MIAEARQAAGVLAAAVQEAQEAQADRLAAVRVAAWPTRTLIAKDAASIQALPVKVAAAWLKRMPTDRGVVSTSILMVVIGMALKEATQK